ncbi:unnamed protein product [Linum tenue]|uniref:Cytochrome P450 n=1 Tax=Linum tenue TaxID=586396 RepID=A0AAV0NL16_9ROSI|nr:unnamed protein product [Linum tenue]
MDFFLFNCLLCLIFTIIALLRFLQKARRNPPPNLPPGPARLPLIGNLHNLGENPHRSLADLAKIHGPLMSLKLGHVTTIVASSPAVAKEILQKHDKVLSDRHVPLAGKAHNLSDFSLTALPVDSKWRNLRKVCNSYIFTTHKLDANQELRNEKIVELVDGVRRNASEKGEVDVGRAAFKATLNSLSATIFSLNLADEEGPETAREFKDLARGIMEEAGKPNLGDYFPVLAKLDLQGIQKRVAGHIGKVLNLFGWVIDQRLQKLKSENYASTNDMLDTLLAIGDDDHNRETTMDSTRIKHLFLDLFVAGTDTTSSTIEWGMTELLRNPDKLAKAKEELNQTIGKGIHLRESDVPRLPYLQAVVKETFRLHPAAPLLLPRKAGVDVEICGFTVPKGAQILVNVWAIGRDSMTWDNPNSFMPERFLGSKVDAKGNNFELLPFGAGRRICPGMPLALRMLHMMLGSLIHWFEWRLPNGVVPEKIDMEEKFGLALQKAEALLAVPTPV